MPTDVWLQWDDGLASPVSTRVERSAGDNLNYSEVANVAPPAQNHKDAALADGTYFYRTRHEETPGVFTGYSNETSITVADLAVPSSPTDLTLTPVTGPTVYLQDDFTGGDYGPPITGRVPSAFGGTGDNAWQEDADQINSTQVRSDRLEIIRLGSSITNGAYIDVGQAQWEGEIDWVSTGTGPTVEFHVRATQGVVKLFVDIRLDSDVLRIRDPGVVRSESIAGGVNPDTPYTLRVTNAADSITGTLVDTGTTTSYSTTQDNAVTGAKVRSYLTASGQQLEVTEIRITELP